MIGAGLTVITDPKAVGAVPVKASETATKAVIGTLKNTLGPHHAGTQIGAAWPPMFRRAPADGLPPGANYATIPYGLTKDFLLIEEQTKR